jgi:hypothetical protein
MYEQCNGFEVKSYLFLDAICVSDLDKLQYVFRRYCD